MRILRTALAAVALCVIFLCCSLDPGAGSSDGPYTKMTVGPDGGVFDIDGTATITFPAGAVSANTEIRVRRLQPDRWTHLFDNYAHDDFELLRCFEIAPASLAFGEAVTVRFSGLDCNPRAIPLTHTANFSTGTHFLAESVTAIDHTEGWLSVAVASGGAYMIEANYGWQGASAGGKGLRSTESCREELIVVETSDKNIQCTFQDCQITESAVKVQFMSCPDQPVESAILRECSVSCAPVVNLSAGASTMGTNRELPITATVKIGCMEVQGQAVDFSATGPATISPPNAETGEDGVATATLISGDEEGTATVTCAVSVRYPVREIIINGSVEEAFHRTEPASATVQVVVRDVPTWHIALDVALEAAPHCGGPYNEYVTYAAHVEGELSLETKDNSTGYVDVNGTQTLGEITIEVLYPYLYESATVGGTSAPSPFPCRIDGYYHSGNVHFFVTDQGDDARFATWTVELVSIFGDSSLSEGFMGNFFACSTGNTFTFPAEEATYTTSGCMKTPTYVGTFSLSASRIQ